MREVLDSRVSDSGTLQRREQSRDGSSCRILLSSLHRPVVREWLQTVQEIFVGIVIMEIEFQVEVTNNPKKRWEDMLKGLNVLDWSIVFLDSDFHRQL